MRLTVIRTGGIRMGGQLISVHLRVGCKSGVLSTRRAEKPTVTGTRDMILRPFGNGGTVGYSRK